MGLTATLQTTYADGQEVLATDLDSQVNAPSNFAGEAMAAIIGVENANADDTPLTVIATGSMNISVGGSGQKVLCQGVLCDYLPGVSITLVGASGQDRIDLLVMQAAQLQVNTFVTNFLSTSGVVAPGAAFQQASGCNFQVVMGTPGAGVPPAVPAGWVSVATIFVGASVSFITQGNITLTLPLASTFISAMAPSVGSTVTTLNGQSGAMVIDSPDSSVTVVRVGQTIHLTTSVVGPIANPVGSTLWFTGTIPADSSPLRPDPYTIVTTSITLPLSSGTTWALELAVFAGVPLGSMQGTIGSIVVTVGPSIFYSVAFANTTGGQTIPLTWVMNGGGSGWISGGASWRIMAIRLT